MAWYLFGIIAGNAADLDFLPGLLIGDVNQFHRGTTHSLAAAAVFGIISGLVARPFVGKPLWIGVAGAIMYSSHLLLDMLTSDGRAPYGVPLFAPFYSVNFASPWTIFGGIRHGNPGDSLSESVVQLFSWGNAAIIGMEILILFPVVLLTWFLVKPKAGKSNQSTAKLSKAA